MVEDQCRPRCPWRALSRRLLLVEGSCRRCLRRDKTKEGEMKVRRRLVEGVTLRILFGVAFLMFVEQLGGHISGGGRLCSGPEFRLFSGRFPFVQVSESATAGTHSSVTISNCK